MNEPEDTQLRGVPFLLAEPRPRSQLQGGDGQMAFNCCRPAYVESSSGVGPTCGRSIHGPVCASASQSGTRALTVYNARLHKSEPVLRRSAYLECCNGNVGAECKAMRASQRMTIPPVAAAALVSLRPRDDIQTQTRPLRLVPRRSRRWHKHSSVIADSEWVHGDSAPDVNRTKLSFLPRKARLLVTQSSHLSALT